MKRTADPAATITMGLLIILMFWTLILAWRYAVHSTLLQSEIDSLQLTLDQERMQHEVDLARSSHLEAELHSKIADLETDLAIAQDEIEDKEHQIRVLQELGSFRINVSQLTDSEKLMLKRIAMAEAGNQGVIGKALVMLTVLNRVDCPGKYGNSVEGVALSGAYTVTQPGGGYWTCVPDWECEVALFLVLHGWNESILCAENDINEDLRVIYFTNQGYSAYGDQMFQYRDHWFSGFSY